MNTPRRRRTPEDPEKVRTRCKAWRQAHPEYLDYHREYRRTHVEERHETNRQWRIVHHEQRCQYLRDDKARLKADVFAVLGNQCSNTACGYSDVRALQIDHINGGGGKERHAGLYGRKLLKHVAANPDGYQILCANCNWIKRTEHHEYHIHSREWMKEQPK